MPRGRVDPAHARSRKLVTSPGAGGPSGRQRGLGAGTGVRASAGTAAPTYPVLGDHDVLVAGEIVPTPLTRSLAIGDRALWELPSGLTLTPRCPRPGRAVSRWPAGPWARDRLLERGWAGRPSACRPTRPAASCL